jgi:riboflavin biosynthesis pyrimidine reductase
VLPQSAVSPARQSSPTDQQLLGTLRRFADVVLVGAGTARPVRLTDA